MKYCVIKNTTRDITQGIDEKKLIESALNTELDGELLKIGEFEILTEEEYQARKALEPQPPQAPSTEERLQMAEDTLMFLLMGGI